MNENDQDKNYNPSKILKVCKINSHNIFKIAKKTLMKFKYEMMDI